MDFIPSTTLSEHLVNISLTTPSLFLVCLTSPSSCAWLNGPTRDLSCMIYLDDKLVPRTWRDCNESSNVGYVYCLYDFRLKLRQPCLDKQFPVFIFVCMTIPRYYMDCCTVKRPLSIPAKSKEEFDIARITRFYTTMTSDIAPTDSHKPNLTNHRPTTRWTHYQQQTIQKANQSQPRTPSSQQAPPSSKTSNH